MPNKRMTGPQENGLRYFGAVEDRTLRVGRFKTRYRRPTPVTIDSLSRLGLVRVHNDPKLSYGTWKLTGEGRSALKALGAP